MRHGNKNKEQISKSEISWVGESDMKPNQTCQSPGLNPILGNGVISILNQICPAHQSAQSWQDKLKQILFAWTTSSFIHPTIFFGWINSKQIYWHNIYSLTIWLNVLFISFQKYMYIKIECAHSFYVVSEFCNLEGIQILFASKVKQQRMFKERKAFEGWGKNVFVTFLHEKNYHPQQHWPYSWIAGFNLWPSWQGWVNPAPPLYV